MKSFSSESFIVSAKNGINLLTVNQDDFFNTKNKKLWKNSITFTNLKKLPPANLLLIFMNDFLFLG